MALGNIAGGSNQRRDAAVDAGALGALCNVLRTHAASPSVAAVASASLREIATFTDAQRNQAVQAGALPILIGVLKAHLAMPSVCEAACGALR
jgi:hypothetical protein